MNGRHQQGYIWRKARSWYGRWREDVLDEGRVVRKQRSRKLADYIDRYRSESDVQPLLDEILKPINTGKVSPESTLTIDEYVEQFYLPYAEENCKPSTYSGYKTQWQMYLAPRLTRAVLRDFRTVHAANLLADIHRAHGLGRSTLRHLKAFLSGVFTYAKNQGVLDSINPITDAEIPRKAAPPKPTHAATPDELLAMLNVLTGKARAAVALMYFCGLRPGEARGARWEDYDGRCIAIHQSVWRTYATEPKTADSCKPVPVIEPLRTILAELREADGNPQIGPVLRGPSGKPLNLDNLARREIRPLLSAAGLAWHGYYMLRRGIATLLRSVEKDSMAAKGLLRHSSVATTERHYIKDVPEITQNAMKKVEALCTERATTPAVRPS